MTVRRRREPLRRKSPHPTESKVQSPEASLGFRHVAAHYRRAAMTSRKSRTSERYAHVIYQESVTLTPVVIPVIP